MEPEQNVGGRDRLSRALLAAVLSVLAVRWLKAGKRGRGVLAGIGALGFGFNATTGYCGVNDALDVDTTAGEGVSIGFEDEETTEAGERAASSETTDAGAQLTCALCGEPIVPGQSRGPDDQGQIVHDDCA